MTGARLCLAAMTAFTLVAGCGGGGDPGPSAAQAGETLKTHITQLMTKADLRDFDVTDPGGKDVPCGDEGTKRTYGVKSTFRMDTEVLIAELVGTLKDVWGYKVDHVVVPYQGKTVLKLASARTTVTLDLPETDVLTVTGETDCVADGT